MSLENKTVAQINKLIIDQLEAQLGQTIPILPKAFNRILAKVLSGVFITLYKVSQWIFLQIFVSSASWGEVEIYGNKIRPLVEWGRLIGVGDPLPATQAELELEITVNTIGETLLSGTQFTSDINGLIYITQEDYLLSAATETIEVICITGGILGNLEIGQELLTVVTGGIIGDTAEITDIVVAGVEAESEDDYRQRVIERFQLQPQGGALADYRIWSSDVAGVLQTYIYTGDPPSYVMVYVAGDPDLYSDRIPSAGLLIAVGDAITYDPDTSLATRKPLTAIIDPAGDESYSNILPVSILTFDVEITDLVADNLVDTKASIRAALDIYFLSREPYIIGLSYPPAKDKITQAGIIGLINDIVQAYNGSFTTAIIYIATIITPSHTLEEGQLCKLGTLTYT